MAYSVPAIATFNLPMNRTSQPRGTPRILLVFGACFLFLLAACGQTGPLYLPDKTAEEVPAEAPPISEETSEDEIETDDDNL